MTTSNCFVDTNFFLECRIPAEINWADLPTPANHVHIIVPSTVISEIDRHKTAGGRTQRRALAASAMFRLALRDANHTVEIQAANPRITLALPPVTKTDYSRFPDLDPTVADHRIAAECATLLRHFPAATLITDDTNLVIAARSIGLDPFLVPEQWKLPPGNDERDAEVIKLKEELRKHQNARPKITLTASSDAHAKEVSIEAHTYTPSKADIDAVVEGIRARNPMTTSFTNDAPKISGLSIGTDLIRGAWRAPSSDQIAKYRDQEYPAWIESVRKTVASLPKRLGEWSREAHFTVSITNDGYANATDVRLTITAHDPLLLLDELVEDDRKERDEGLVLPRPPIAPAGSFLHDAFRAMMQPHATLLDSVLNIPRIGTPSPRDRNAFYYVGGRPDEPTRELELHCDALPHQDGQYSLSFRVISPEGLQPFQSRVRIRVHASNLLDPIDVYLPVVVATTAPDFATVASMLTVSK